MTRSICIAAALLLAGTAAASAPATHPPRADGYDIHAEYIVTAGETCGHWASLDGSPLSSVDWAVNGVVVAQDASGMNYLNDGSPYTVSIGEVSGGVFSAWYSEEFTPQELPYVACFTV
ncbi:hypothetical protein [Longimicrobium sp.]|uniref:hypothetical protein n=1 Tax=Longimicrobium sp. TaxID=2029185 RepID=UPI002E36C038|nr:hypothetical protein [Longimicrobium sp.]HEX6037543.1 hypothetical protein [Longimicrobium sp.]